MVKPPCSLPPLRFHSGLVAADERSEAASGCEATVKPEPGIHLIERSVRFYDGCVAVAHQTDRSLRSSAAATGKQLTRVHIRHLHLTAILVSPLRRVPFVKQPQKEPKRPCPWRTAFAALRFPRSGSAPWARRHGPSLAHRGSPGIHAGRPTPQNLLSASRWGGYIKIKSLRGGRPACWCQCVLRNFSSRQVFIFRTSAPGSGIAPSGHHR